MWKYNNLEHYLKNQSHEHKLLYSQYASRECVFLRSTRSKEVRKSNEINKDLIKLSTETEETTSPEQATFPNQSPIRTINSNQIQKVSEVTLKMKLKNA